MLRYLSLNIIWSSKLTVSLSYAALGKPLPFETLIVRGQISEHISAPNGGYYLYMSLVLKIILFSCFKATPDFTIPMRV